MQMTGAAAALFLLILSGAPDYGREAEPAAKADEGNGESDILII